MDGSNCKLASQSVYWSVGPLVSWQAGRQAGRTAVSGWCCMESDYDIGMHCPLALHHTGVCCACGTTTSPHVEQLSQADVAWRQTMTLVCIVHWHSITLVSAVALHHPNLHQHGSATFHAHRYSFSRYIGMSMQSCPHENQTFLSIRRERMKMITW